MPTHGRLCLTQNGHLQIFWLNSLTKATIRHILKIALNHREWPQVAQRAASLLIAALDFRLIRI